MVRESVRSKLARLFNRNKGGTAAISQHREKEAELFVGRQKKGRLPIINSFVVCVGPAQRLC